MASTPHSGPAPQMSRLALPFVMSPLMRRVIWHLHRVGGQMDRRLFFSLGQGSWVTDIVSGGVGTKMYRITMSDEYIGFSIDAVSAHLRLDHRATMLSVNRGGRTFGRLRPLKLKDAMMKAR